ncbi:MAG: phosphatidylglycerophosphatase A [Deltaproteobacteria bacterium]|nr:phosphatidylglycerophosphatase A [Deltaproteobacteria bacterium]
MSSPGLRSLFRRSGTAGTIWGAVIAYFISGATVPFQALLTTLITLISMPLAAEMVRYTGKDDPTIVVIDEVAGFLISIFLIPFTAFNVILVFILFRFFDILKPYPAGLIDRAVGGGTGVVLDDVAAGVYANISAHLLIWLLKL